MASGSINSTVVDNTCQPKSGFLDSLGGLFGCRSRRPSTHHVINGGYVEFGDMHCEEQRELKVGTFAGVFCPVVLSMFSALVFIRMGFIIGNAGLLMTLLQFAISYVILLFTVSSVCAISTNGAIEGGGVYFMISRSLGPEFGGAIGTLFFFANIVSSALCFSACTEGLMESFGPSGYLIGDSGWSLQPGRWWLALYGSLLAMLALLISLAGAKYFARASLAIWAAVTVALTSILVSFLIPGEKEVKIPESNTVVNSTLGPVYGNYTGLSVDTLTANLWPSYGRDYSSEGQQVDFATVFGILFSGVTGVMAGANMSGELRNPGRSIPRGTLAAIVFTGLTYLALSLFTAASCDRFLLQNNYIYMLPINVWPPFVAIGILTATFSAGLSNMIGASRVLEALIKDNLFGSLMRWCSGPALCVLVSWIVVEIALLGGSLTAIARANCALFLLSYLAVNLACLALELAGAPNFRPSFKWFSWQSSLCGLVGALCMMFIAASALAGVAIILCLLLVISLHLASPAAAAAPWGSISQALIFHQVRKYLLLLDTRKEHVKYWRPQVLLLVGGARSAPPLARFANHLKKGGLLVLGHVRRASPLCAPQPTAYGPWLQLVDHLRVKAFVEICLSSSVREGSRQLAHLSGLGAMKPNTIMLGFHGDTPPQDLLSREESPFHSSQLEASFPPREQAVSGPAEYVAILSDMLAMDKNVCVCRHFHNLDMKQVERSSQLKYIDIWLTDFVRPCSGDPFSVAGLFTLQLACILSTQANWRRLKLRVMLTDTAETPPQRTTPFIVNRAEGNGSGAEAGLLEEASPSEREVAVARLASSSRPTQARLVELLKLLRIQAAVHQVEEWANEVEVLRFTKVKDQSGRLQDSGSGNHSGDSRHPQLPPAYIRRVNEMIRMHSSVETACVFLYLPPPPTPSPQPSHLQSWSSSFKDIRRTADPSSFKDPFGLSSSPSDVSNTTLNAESDQSTIYKDPFLSLNNSTIYASQNMLNESLNNYQGRPRNQDLEDLPMMEKRLAEECQDRVQYMSFLKEITEDLPPTVLVHGLKSVTSTVL